MYYHVIENCQRDGVKVYRLVKTYKRYSMLQRWLDKTGQPVWVIANGNDSLQNTVHLGGFGGFVASYWNSGGWGFTRMPVLPFWSGK